MMVRREFIISCGTHFLSEWESERMYLTKMSEGRTASPSVTPFLFSTSTWLILSLLPTVVRISFHLLITWKEVWIIPLSSSCCMPCLLPERPLLEGKSLTQSVLPWEILVLLLSFFSSEQTIYPFEESVLTLSGATLMVSTTRVVVLAKRE